MQIKHILAFLCLVLFSGVVTADVTGKAHVTDGDTVKIGDFTTHHSNAGSVTLRESIPQSCHNPVLASTDNSGLMARSLNY